MIEPHAQRLGFRGRLGHSRLRQIHFVASDGLRLAEDLVVLECQLHLAMMRLGGIELRHLPPAIEFDDEVALLEAFAFLEPDFCDLNRKLGRDHGLRNGAHEAARGAIGFDRIDLVGRRLAAAAQSTQQPSAAANSQPARSPAV